LHLTALYGTDEEICLDPAAEYIPDDDVSLRDLSCVDVADQEVYGTQGPAVDVSDDRVDLSNIAPVDVAYQKVNLLCKPSVDVPTKDVDKREQASFQVSDSDIA
jgi:hypothetical protein